MQVTTHLVFRSLCRTRRLCMYCSAIVSCTIQSITIFSSKLFPFFLYSVIFPSRSPPCKVTQNKNQCYNFYMTSKPIPFLYSVIFPPSSPLQDHPKQESECYNLYMTSKPIPFLYSVIFPSRSSPARSPKTGIRVTIFT